MQYNTAPLAFFYDLIEQHGLENRINSFFAKVNPEWQYIKHQYTEDLENYFVSFWEPDPEGNTLFDSVPGNIIRFDLKLELSNDLAAHKRFANNLIYNQLRSLAPEKRAHYINGIEAELDYLIAKSANMQEFTKFPAIAETLQAIRDEVEKQSQRLPSAKEHTGKPLKSELQSPLPLIETFLYNKLKAVEKLPETTEVEKAEKKEEYHAAEDGLKKLYEELRNQGYIENKQLTQSPADFWLNFKHIFNGGPLKNPIIWKTKLNQLAHLIRYLISAEKITCSGNHYWRVGSQCFLDEDGKPLTPGKLSDAGKKITKENRIKIEQVASKLP